jgi:hypothetical protein
MQQRHPRDQPASDAIRSFRRASQTASSEMGAMVFSELFHAGASPGDRILCIIDYVVCNGQTGRCRGAGRIQYVQRPGLAHKVKVLHQLARRRKSLRSHPRPSLDKIPHLKIRNQAL